MINKEDLYRRPVSQATGKRVGWGQGGEGGGSVASLKGPLGKRTTKRTLYADAYSMSHPHSRLLLRNLRFFFPIN